VKTAKEKLKICSRGHKLYKSSDCPVWPICRSEYYRKRAQNGFPEKLGAPAPRGLLNAKIIKLTQLAKHSEVEIAELHGMGPKSISHLKTAMRKQSLSFRKIRKRT